MMLTDWDMEAVNDVDRLRWLRMLTDWDRETVNDVDRLR